MSRVNKVIQHFYWLIRLSGFYLGQSYLATLVTPQNCTKCLEILLLLYKLHILASDQKKFFVFFRATFEELLFVFWATFLRNTGNFLKNLEQLVESLTTHDSLRLTMAQKFVIVTSYTKWKLSFWRKSYMLNRHLTIRRRRRQRERHKSNRFN